MRRIWLTVVAAWTLNGSVGEAMLQTVQRYGLLLRDGRLGYRPWFGGMSSKTCPVDFFDKKVGNLLNQKGIQNCFGNVQQKKQAFSIFKCNPRVRISASVSLALQGLHRFEEGCADIAPYGNFMDSRKHALRKVFEILPVFTDGDPGLYARVQECLRLSFDHMRWGNERSAYDALTGRVSVSCWNTVQLYYALLYEMGHAVEHFLEKESDPHYQMGTEIYSHLFHIGAILDACRGHSYSHVEPGIHQLFVPLLTEYQRLSLVRLFLGRDKVLLSNVFKTLGITKLDPLVPSKILVQTVTDELRKGLGSLQSRSLAGDFAIALWALSLGKEEISSAMEILKRSPHAGFTPDWALKVIPSAMGTLKILLASFRKSEGLQEIQRSAKPQIFRP